MVLRASISRLSARNLHISESLDLESVLHEALEPLRTNVHQIHPPVGTAINPPSLGEPASGSDSSPRPRGTGP